MNKPLCVAACAVIAAAFLYLNTDSTAISTLPTPVPGVEIDENQFSSRSGCFIPNLGQWDHDASFVHQSGPVTLFLEERGWVIDVRSRPIPPIPSPAGPDSVSSAHGIQSKHRGVALRMNFEGDIVPRTAGENAVPGRHNYFLGNDPARWRTNVPRFQSVKYEGLYDGIDLRLRYANEVPEYDLLLQPGADLAKVVVRVDGAQDMRVQSDGSLSITTGEGSLIQSRPQTWQMYDDGRIEFVDCRFVRLDAQRFGFSATTWNREAHLTIDPGLVWSSYLGGTDDDDPMRLRVTSRGHVVVAGFSLSTDFPTTIGAYDRIRSVDSDVFVSRFDPKKTGVAQLEYSTFVGGNGWDWASALAVDTDDVVTLSGATTSLDYPTTPGAYSRTLSGREDIFVCQLDPSKNGAAQLTYGTLLGGLGGSDEDATSIFVDALGAITIAGYSGSASFPTTLGAYDVSFNGNSDAIIARLDPGKLGTAQLLYSTFLGSSGRDEISRMAVGLTGVISFTGSTGSSNFPTTSGAFDTTHNGSMDGFVGKLDLRRIGNAQLVYSTFLGGLGEDWAHGIALADTGLITVIGETQSPGFPTTNGAYDQSFNGSGNRGSDAFVSQLDPTKVGGSQLTYSTFLGGGYRCFGLAVSITPHGGLTVIGKTRSRGFPTTVGAWNRSHSGGEDGFVCRLDPRRTSSAQLVYSTLFPGGIRDLALDGSGTAWLTGRTYSSGFPTTRGAYGTVFKGPRNDGFVSRLDMGIALFGDQHQIAVRTGGTQRLTLNSGPRHANREYWVFGSITGTSPGFRIGGAHFPLNVDAYTHLAMASVNSNVFTAFRGTLDTNGRGEASFNVPAALPIPLGLTIYHAYAVYDSSGFRLISNPVPVSFR